MAISYKTVPVEPVRKRIADAILNAIRDISEPVYMPPLYYSFKLPDERYYFRRSDFHREIKRLDKRGFIALTKIEKGWIFKILDKGRKQLEKIDLDNLTLKQPKQWDGKWRLFVFDIPETHRGARDALRKKLKELGLYNIQRSVFAYPHDCREELEIIADAYGLKEYATYAETAFIDIDKELRRYFRP